MRALLILILALAVVLGGGYTALWFMNAEDIKAKLEALKQGSSRHPMIESMTFETATVSGFPMQYEVTLTNPQIMFDAESAMQEIRPEPLMPGEWKEGWRVNGTMVFTADALGRDFTLSTQGEQFFDIITPGQSFRLQSTGMDSTIRLKINQMLLLEHFPYFTDALAMPADRWVDGMRNVGIRVGGGTLMDTQSGALLLESEGGVLDVGRTLPDADTQRLDVLSQMEGTTVTEAGSQFLQYYIQNVVLRSGETSVFFRPQLHLNGMMNHHIDITATVPRDMQAAPEEVPQGPVDIEIRKFSFSDDMSTSDTSGTIYVDARHSPVVGLIIDVVSTGNVTPQWYDAKRQEVESLAALLADAVPGSKDADPEAATLQRQQKFQVALPELIPRFHEAGTMKTVVRVSTIDEKGEAPSDAELHIHEFSISTDAYGVAVTGSGSMETGAAPGGTFTVTFTRAGDWIGALADYLRRAVGIYKMVEDPNFPLEITPELEAAVLDVLRMTSDEPQASNPDIVTTVSMQGEQGPTIGTLQVQQAMMLAQSMLMPFVQPAIEYQMMKSGNPPGPSGLTPEMVPPGQQFTPPPPPMPPALPE